MRNPRQFVEKRDYIRMSIDCPVSYQLADSDASSKSGTCINLSAKGILFKCPDQYPEGALLDISVKPQLSISPPFNAKMKVIRVEHDMSSNAFSIAGTLESIN